MYILIALFFSLISVGAMAQDNGSTPIFINPYNPTVTSPSRVPTIIGSPRKTLSSNRYSDVTKAGDYSTPVYHENDLQFPSWYGRSRAEKTYYDSVTGRQMKQYEYMGTLAARGDSQRLNEVVRDVQSNGVFNPDHYRAAVAKAQKENAEGKMERKTNPHETSRVTADGRKRVFTMKTPDNGVSLPRRVHDLDSEKAGSEPATQTQRSNQPIFLH